MRISDWSSDVCSSDLLLSWLILGYIHARRAAGLPARVYVTAFTRNAIGNLLDAVVERANIHWPAGFDVHFFGSAPRSEEHTSELQSLMRISYAVFCLKKKKKIIRKILERTRHTETI